MNSPNKKPTTKKQRPRPHADERKIERARILEDSSKRLEFPRLLEIIALYASSQPGKKAVLNTAPLSSIDEIHRWLDEGQEIAELMKTGFSFQLELVPDLCQLLGVDAQGRNTASARVLSGFEVFCVFKLLERNFILGDSFRRQAGYPHLLARAARMEDQQELRERLQLSVDAKGEILSSASMELAKIRERISTLEQQLRIWMEKRRQSKEIQSILQENVVSLRNGRFVFAVRAQCRGQMPGVVHGESSSGQTVFIEPQAIVLKGNELSELYGALRREEARILLELSTLIRSNALKLLKLAECLIELDQLHARARFAKAFDCNKPVIEDSRRLILKGARHPLLLWRDRKQSDTDYDTYSDLGLEQLKESIIPLDMDMGNPEFQMVVTGPNTGGKTVSLKLCGLLSLMALSGIPIPADKGSQIPFFDSILADIGDEQSLEQDLSTFSSHVTVIRQILKFVSSRSLVLIDELGAGTDPLEGAALGQAILEDLYRRGAFSFVSTHLGRLKEYAFKQKKCINACMEFDANALAPTYRLLHGLPGRSNAIIIAQRIGLSKEVTDSAQQLMEGPGGIDAAVLDGLERTRQDMQRRKNEAAKEHKEVVKLKKDAKHELDEAKNMRFAIEHEAERLEEERVTRIANRLENYLKQLGDPPRDKREIYAELRSEITQARKQTRLAERRQEVAQKLKKGDLVYVPRFRSISEVRKINKGKECITVLFNGVPAELSFQEISWILPPPGYEAHWV